MKNRLDERENSGMMVNDDSDNGDSPTNGRDYPCYRNISVALNILVFNTSLIAAILFLRVLIRL